MKKMFFLALLALLCCSFAFSQSAGSTMYVAVKNAEVKSSTGTFASNVGTLGLGDTVTVARVNGKWVEIKAKDALSGWVALSNLSSRRVTGSGYSASAGEIALAGKGFSPETEKQYQANGLNYAAVDNMEAISIPIPELKKFVDDGHLAKGE